MSQYWVGRRMSGPGIYRSDMQTRMTARRISRPALVLLTAFAMIGCTRISVGSNSGARSLSDFDFLELGMSYEEIVDVVGEADRDVGSGLYLKVYDLDDGRQITLQFATLDALLGVFLHNPETDEEEVLLGLVPSQRGPAVG